MTTENANAKTSREGEAKAHGAESGSESIPSGPILCNIPEDLKALPAWLCWRRERRNGKPTKVPYNARTGRRGKSNDPKTWSDFATACEHAPSFDGIGIAFCEDLCGVDLDHCIDPETGELETWAQEIIDALASYTEISPSGTGLHILLRGELPPGRRKRGDVECYGEGSPKYFTVTGRHLPGTPAEVNHRNGELAAFHARWLQADADKASPPPVAEPSPSPRPTPRRTNATDEERLAAAFNAKNCAEIIALFNEPGGDGGSEGDAALAWKLAFYSDGDPMTLERLMRRSARVRPKWDDKRPGGTWIGLECAKAVANCAEFWTPPKGKSDPNEQPDTDGLPVADRLVEIALAEADLFRDPSDNRFATVPGGRTCALQERGGGLRDWLARRWREETGRTPHASALAAATAQVLAEAGIAPVREVALRVAEEPGGETLFVDLCNAPCEVVRVTPDGWSVTPDLPETLRFRRPPDLRPLPRPVRGPGLEALREVVNFSSDTDFMLCVAWLLAALRPGYPYPVLALTGEQGSAKSTATRILRSLVDPHGADGRGVTRPPREDKDLFAIAASTHVLALDNISAIGPDLSDSLSALATGAGLETRRLYTDGDVASLYARRPIIINGIGSSGAEIASRADLLDRTLCVTLAPIPEDRRRTEKALWPEVTRIAPGVLAALLDATAKALRNLPNLPPMALPRMADFAAWIVAAEPALPWSPGEFLSVYATNRTDAQGTLLETDPVAGYILSLAEAGTGWSGPPRALFLALEGMTTEGERKQAAWPKSPAALGKHLTRIAPALRQAGVIITPDRAVGGKRERVLVLTKAG